MDAADEDEQQGEPGNGDWLALALATTSGQVAAKNKQKRRQQHLGDHGGGGCLFHREFSSALPAARVMDAAEFHRHNTEGRKAQVACSTAFLRRAH